MTMRRVGIAGAIVVGGVLVLNVLAGGVDRAVGGRGPGGAAGSSYATQGDGLAAYASMLARWDHPVVRQRGALRGARLDPRDTLVVIDPSILSDDDTAALLELATAGARLVIGGGDPESYVHRLRDDPPSWSPTGARSYRDVNSSFANVQRVVTAGRGSWHDIGDRAALVRDGTRVLLTEEPLGRGRLLLLADTTPLHNGYLARADDAAFGVLLAGEPGRRVVFAEGVHGYGAARGLRALPTRWKLALSGVVLAALLLAWSRARRLGPPDLADRDLAPARAQYVDALAITLERARDPVNALAGVQRWARDAVARRARLRPDASAEELTRAATTLGCPADERAALLAPPRTRDDVLALGRAVARLGDAHGRTG